MMYTADWNLFLWMDRKSRGDVRCGFHCSAGVAHRDRCIQTFGRLLPVPGSLPDHAARIRRTCLEHAVFLVPNYFVLCAVVGGFGEHAETLAAANVRTAIDPKVSLEGWASLRCSRPIKCARHLPVFRQRSRELGLGPTRPSTVQPRARG